MVFRVAFRYFAVEIAANRNSIKLQKSLCLLFLFLSLPHTLTLLLLLFFYLVLSSEHSFSTVLTRLFQPRRIFFHIILFTQTVNNAKASYNSLFKLFIE